jgi:glycosyltransferase involved in cell wall biosynthesis
MRVASRINWPLFVVGGAPLTPVGMSHANAHFMGELHDADRFALFCRSSLFVQVDDAAGYGVLDAALCGCALVLADVPELREKWNGAAAYVARNDEDTLRSTLISLIGDGDARRDLGERARHRAQTFTAERMSAAYLTAYIDLALNGPAAFDVAASGSALSTDRPELSHS